LLYICGGILALVILAVLARPVRSLWRVAANTVLGAVFLLLFRYLMGPFGFHIALNPVTALVLGVLGLPGAVMLAVISCLL